MRREATVSATRPWGQEQPHNQASCGQARVGLSPVAAALLLQGSPFLKSTPFSVGCCDASGEKQKLYFRGTSGRDQKDFLYPLSQVFSNQQEASAKQSMFFHPKGARGCVLMENV